MNKTELVNAVAKQANLTQDQAKAAVNAAIKAEDKVTLLGFGTFSISERAERKGINPATKQEITIPAKKVVKFKPGAQLEVK